MASTPEEHQYPDESEADAASSITAGVDEQARISSACDARDVEELRALAIAPGGFLSDQLRAQACKSTDSLLFQQQQKTICPNTELFFRANTTWV